jgi:mannose-6-phosphate isomerase-like protein (cupin superfamily)
MAWDTKRFKAAAAGQGVVSAAFPEPEDVGPRQWGTEELLFKVSGKFTFKRIYMHEGAKGGLQYHHKKDEGGYVTCGMAIVRYDPGSGTLVDRIVEEGDAFFFPQGAVHQIEAITAFEYIEVSTPYLNDRVHVEYLYGIEQEAGGLPSTSLEDVIEA